MPVASLQWKPKVGNRSQTRERTVLRFTMTEVALADHGNQTAPAPQEAGGPPWSTVHVPARTIFIQEYFRDEDDAQVLVLSISANLHEVLSDRKELAGRAGDIFLFASGSSPERRGSVFGRIDHAIGCGDHNDVLVTLEGGATYVVDAHAKDESTTKRARRIYSASSL
jgi:hypothetical protein